MGESPQEVSTLLVPAMPAPSIEPRHKEDTTTITTTTTIAGTTGAGTVDYDAIQIGGVDDVPKGEWSLASGKKSQGKQPGTMPSAKAADSISVQALTDSSFTKVCIDSGAGESVCPPEAFPSYQTAKTAKTGTTYRAAGGQRLTNIGEKKPCFKSNGLGGCMAFQATTDVQKPLVAASKVASKGNRIVLDDASSDSYIENKKTGKRIPLVIENGVYMMEMLVVPFQGPTK